MLRDSLRKCRIGQELHAMRELLSGKPGRPFNTRHSDNTNTSGCSCGAASSTATPKTESRFTRHRGRRLLDLVSTVFYDGSNPSVNFACWVSYRILKKCIHTTLEHFENKFESRMDKNAKDRKSKDTQPGSKTACVMSSFSDILQFSSEHYLFLIALVVISLVSGGVLTWIVPKYLVSGG